jgi:deazaflavin-dependent oxidoreductase (nitroreductase family)
MDSKIANALASDQVIDITTIGRKTGEARRIEIWFHRVDGRYYITGTPDAARSWYANLVANPEFVFHVKQSATADLDATARAITDTAERTAVFGGIAPGLGELTSQPGMELDVWIAKSPLVEVTFTS